MFDWVAKIWTSLFDREDDCDDVVSDADGMHAALHAVFWSHFLTHSVASSVILAGSPIFWATEGSLSVVITQFCRQESSLHLSVHDLILLTIGVALLPSDLQAVPKSASLEEAMSQAWVVLTPVVVSVAAQLTTASRHKLNNFIMKYAIMT